MAATKEIETFEDGGIEQNAVKVVPGTELVSQEAKHEIKTCIAFAGKLKVVKISTEEELYGAEKLDNKLRELEESLNDYYDKEVKSIYRQYKDAGSLFSPAQNAIRNGRAQIRKALGQYHQEQEMKRREAQRIADEKAERERKKFEERARKYEEQGKEHLVESNMEKAMMVQPEVVEAPTTRLKSTSFREQPVAEVEDMGKLLAAISGNPALWHCVDIKNNELAKLWGKNSALSIPGVKFSTSFVPVKKRR